MAEYTTHRQTRPRQRGVLSVEAAYVLPVVIAAAMIFMELGNVGLTINMGASAFERAMQQFRQDGVLALQDGSADMEALLRERMASASHGYLAEDNIITIDVQTYTNLDALGDGTASQEDADGNTATGGDTDVPAWRVSVEIRKSFITPLPRLLGVDNNAFRYRYQQVLAYLPQQERAE
ncbi:hypothetical protein D8I35_10205 [Corticibacter populi]|uniref:Pilus assembly protein n=1 Tax=Corticibacter populi TaxID=1550736 RepID=A0A3M6QV07_9BURK|nr:hypothetical protein [Corticibacter populi]RMX06854.1 hypothetical protein D8I35_10205 [Corticibacter populi]RZS31555.1 hypothetical protein EV687_2212 [Corticibacter populi]